MSFKGNVKWEREDLACAFYVLMAERLKLIAAHNTANPALINDYQLMMLLFGEKLLQEVCRFFYYEVEEQNFEKFLATLSSVLTGESWEKRSMERFTRNFYREFSWCMKKGAKKRRGRAKRLAQRAEKANEKCLL